MSVGLFIASDYKLEEVKNPHYKTFSINQALEQGIEIEHFLLDGTHNQDEPNVILVPNYSIVIDGTGISDGDADDNFALLDFDTSHYSKKTYGVYIEWHYYTDKRAEKIINYIKNTLLFIDCVEIWKVWLSDYNPPVIKTVDIHINELRPEKLKEFSEYELWNNSDPDTPTYYCMNIYK